MAEGIRSIDNFFYYGKTELHQEIQHDLLLGIVQPKRSMYYFRDYGAGVPEYENEPLSAAQEIGMQFDIVDFIARRNGRVSDGSGGSRDRRVAVSQSTVAPERRGRGEINVQVLYVALADYENPQTANILGGR